MSKKGKAKAAVSSVIDLGGHAPTTLSKYIVLRPKNRQQSWTFAEFSVFRRGSRLDALFFEDDALSKGPPPHPFLFWALAQFG